MEKQGMGWRKRSFCIGLLIFLGVFAHAAVHGEDIPQVRVETFPSAPTVNNPWSVYILVRHSNPMDVDVRPPHFPPFLVLERVRADTRILDGEDRWTRVEYRFIPLRPYTANLGAFEVSTPIGRRSTDPINVSFREETARQIFHPQLRWVTPLPSMPAGQTTVLFLELTNWNPNRRIPEGFFWGQAPFNAIVREGYPQTVAPRVYRYPISVIPLDESNITLAAFSFNYDGYNLSVPAINLAVLPAARIEEALLPPDTAPEESIERVIPFPQTRESVFFLFQGEYDRVTARVSALWNENRRAEALAELRRNERDSLVGPFFAPLRLEIERQLGLYFTESERWQPLGIPLAAYAGFTLAIAGTLIFIFVLRPRWIIQRTSIIFIRRRSFVSVIILIFAAGLFIIFLEGALGDFPSGRATSTSAVLKSTYGFRIPDFRGAVNDWFSEGQPVTVSGYTGDWRLAETPDGRSGWVPSEMVITY